MSTASRCQTPLGRPPTPPRRTAAPSRPPRTAARAGASGGLAALPDYELLELYLFRSIPRGDVKPLAKALLARFGSLGGVLARLGRGAEAPSSGVGEAVALDLKLLHEATLRIGRERWPSAR